MNNGITLKKLKTTLMEYYGVKSTELDRGYNPVPHTIYCMKPFFLHNGTWLPQDHCKIGKSHSLYNRARIYSQTGADIRTLWAIDTNDPEWLEYQVHQYLYEYNAKFQGVHATEVFNLDTSQAYDMLDQMASTLNLEYNSSTIAINKFCETGFLSNNLLHDCPYADLNYIPATLGNNFDDLFAEVG